MIFVLAWPFGRGFGFGGGAPKAPPTAPPPPQVTDPSIQANKDAARTAARKRKGRASTLLGGEGPFTAPDDTLSKTTLG
jgi:hypothetical protein